VRLTPSDPGEPPAEADPTRICELQIGLPEVNVLGVIDEPGCALWVVIETRGDRPACAQCEWHARHDDRPVGALVVVTRPRTDTEHGTTLADTSSFVKLLDR